MWFQFKSKGRRHYYSGRIYDWPERVESPYRLDKIFSGVFRLDGGFIPTPRGLGYREILGERTEMKGDIEMKYVNVRQNLRTVPSDAPITKQLVKVTDGDEVVLDVAIPISDSKAPEFWAEVGGAVSVSLTFADDLGNTSTPFVDNYVQEGIPEPTPEPPAPTPEPPAPVPVQLPTPEGLGERELLSQVEAESRPS